MHYLIVLVLSVPLALVSAGSTGYFSAVDECAAECACSAEDTEAEDQGVSWNPPTWGGEEDGCCKVEGAPLCKESACKWDMGSAIIAVGCSSPGVYSSSVTIVNSQGVLYQKTWGPADNPANISWNASAASGKMFSHCNKDVVLYIVFFDTNGDPLSQASITGSCANCERLSDG